MHTETDENVTSGISDAQFETAISEDIKRGFGAMAFNTDAKSRMAHEIRSELDRYLRREGSITADSSATRKRRPVFRFAAAAAAAVAVMTLGTVAYGSGGLVGVGDAVTTLFGADPAPTEIVDKIGRPAGASQSVNGVTVSVDAVISDGKNYSIVYSIKKDDGSAFEGLEATEDGYLNMLNRGQSTDIGLRPNSLGDFASSASGFTYFYDADPSDNAIQMVERTSTDGIDSILGRTAHARFGDFIIYPSDDPERAIVVAKGNWDIAFTFDSEDCSNTVPSDLPLVVPGGDAVMNELAISPIAISAQYTLTPNAGFSYDVDVFRDAASLGDIKIRMKDSTVIIVLNPGGLATSEQDDGTILCSQNIFLPRIIDPDQVSSLIIGGTEFPLD